MFISYLSNPIAVIQSPEHISCSHCCYVWEFQMICSSSPTEPSARLTSNLVGLVTTFPLPGAGLTLELIRLVTTLL
jgi:hypothetical protein